MKRIILTGGGTAGHIGPIIALIKNLENNARIKYLYIGSRSGPEKEISKKENIKFKGIFVGKWRNYFSINNFWDLLKTFVGVIQSFFTINFFKPEIIFAKGGYVTFPILFWAKIFNIPVVIHESDVIMGKANRWASKFARKICLGFPIQNYKGQNLPVSKLIYTGIPLKKDFWQKNNEGALAKDTILITGGSQGSVKINTTIKEILPDLIKKYKIVHLIGQKNKIDFNDNNYQAINFSTDMSSLMKASSLIITRAGANTLAEISALEKPSVLIPLPSAQLDHQNANAKIYEQHNAAVVISEKNLTASSLLSIINHLMEDEKLRTLLGHHAREFACPRATEDIIDILFEVTDEK